VQTELTLKTLSKNGSHKLTFYIGNTLARSGRENNGEFVDDFVTQVKKLAKIAKIGTDDSGKNMLFDVVVQALRPTVRAHVLQSGADNLDKRLEAARVAEVSEVPANVSEPVLNTTTRSAGVAEDC
jgi:hypothetical protein